MPMGGASVISHSQTIAFQELEAHESHDCDGAFMSTNVEHVHSSTHVKQLCHGDNYQCCLGLVVSPSLNAGLFTLLTEQLVSIHSSWVTDPVIQFIYKPPKLII
jgi:hypothetical protein